MPGPLQGGEGGGGGGQDWRPQTAHHGLPGQHQEDDDEDDEDDDDDDDVDDDVDDVEDDDVGGVPSGQGVEQAPVVREVRGGGDPNVGLQTVQ